MWMTDTQPMPRSPSIGDTIAVSHDVLVEIARASPLAPACWRYLPSGARGKLLGWRAHHAVVDVHGEVPRLVVYVDERHVRVHERDGSRA